MPGPSPAEETCLLVSASALDGVKLREFSVIFFLGKLLFL